MTQTHSRSRNQAELAFTKFQTKPDATVRSRAAEELDNAVQSRIEKTARLKEARIARELEARAKMIDALGLKRATKS